MSKKNPEVDVWFNNAEQWQPELKALRKIALACPLTEELKWKTPCYTFEKSNIAMIGGFKQFCVLSFFKGALLKDPQGILVKPGENTRAARVVKFTNVGEITELATSLEAYLQEAIEVEQAGLKVDFRQNQELEIPAELHSKFEEMPELESAFNALTPGRQRAYIMHFSAAKQSKTRTARIDNFTPQILDGKGMHDCTCGLSKKLPACDGSHKSIR